MFFVYPTKYEEYGVIGTIVGGMLIAAFGGALSCFCCARGDRASRRSNSAKVAAQQKTGPSEKEIEAQGNYLGQNLTEVEYVQPMMATFDQNGNVIAHYGNQFGYDPNGSGMEPEYAPDGAYARTGQPMFAARQQLPMQRLPVQQPILDPVYQEQQQQRQMQQQSVMEDYADHHDSQMMYDSEEQLIPLEQHFQGNTTGNGQPTHGLLKMQNQFVYRQEMNEGYLENEEEQIPGKSTRNHKQSSDFFNSTEIPLNQNQIDERNFQRTPQKEAQAILGYSAKQSIGNGPKRVSTNTDSGTYSYGRNSQMDNTAAANAADQSGDPFGGYAQYDSQSREAASQFALNNDTWTDADNPYGDYRNGGVGVDPIDQLPPYPQPVTTNGSIRSQPPRPSMDDNPWEQSELNGGVNYINK